MSALLEVTVTCIQRLADAPLRDLIRRLCQAELSDAGLPLSAVRAGGHQDAPDGGIDVCVDLVGDPAGLDFIPRGQTGLQAKAEAMPASKVAGEMRARGTLKPAIRELLVRGGAYVIVSSKDSCTPPMLRDRLAAMRKVASDAGLPAEVMLDFFGADRIADWTNRHSGVALWLREHLDGPSQGWRGYAAWAASSIDAAFLADDQARVEASGERGTRQLSVAQTLAELRAKLRIPGQAIRLVGLSGTGKTRLVQALFEASLGDEPLPAHLAVYADAGEALQPSAVEMLHRLAAQARPVALLIDNCNPATHRALQAALSARPGRVALLTIEYDIDGGEAEQADVYRLGATTPGLLDRLLELREPRLGHGVRQQIVSLSEGNLRVALALASAARRTGRLSGLSDADLFQRLFWQRQQPDPGLEHAAQVLALVYSFNAEESDVSEADQELTRLARLAARSIAELRRYLGTLLNRGLAQRRGPWRAILPHALANHLAARGLGGVSGDDLWRELRQHERLSLSFARRLSSLHDSRDAQDVVGRWFREAPGMAIFDEHSMQGREIFRLLAPVRPDLALTRLEQLTAVEGQGLLGWHHVLYRDAAVGLAGQLAYPAVDFARAAEVLVRLATHEGSGSNRGENRLPRPLERLFRPLLSGTEADASQRLALLASLLDSSDSRRQRLSLVALRTLLAVNWSGSMPETFGARVRGEGWQPSSEDDWAAWYGGPMRLVAERLCAGHALAAELADLVANAAVALAWDADVLPALERFAAAVAHLPAALCLWRGIAVALLLPPASPVGADSDLRARLEGLESQLRPQSLEDRIEALVYASPNGRVDLLSLEEIQAHRSGAAPVLGHYGQMLADIGAELALRLHEPALLHRLIDNFSPGYTPLLGQRVAERAVDLAGDWSVLIRRYAAAPRESRDAGFVRGFFDGLRARDPELAERLLDDCAAEPVLAELGVELHTGQTVDEAGAARLTALARQGQVPAAKFGWLKFGGLLSGISSASHAELLRSIKALPEGLREAISLHRMRLFGLSSMNAEVDDEARELCAELLLGVDASFADESDWYSVSDLVPAALSGQRGREVAEHLCAVLMERRDGGFLAGVAEVVVGQLFAGRPVVALDAFGPGADDEEEEARKDWWLMDARHEHPLSKVADAVLLAWVAHDAARRGPWLGARIKVFADEPAQGFGPLARALLQQAHDRSRILASFESGALPNSWAGSYAAAAQPFVVRLSALLSADEPDVVAWARAQLQRIEERIAQRDRTERQSAQRFE
ncbi:hypothetical protein ACG04R_00060 [Roseateles sp. BYS78W]|uniref:AAA+ ATPase domain-containing protein n=1 Tax=Pelomonas candidula TaxID=3299025 RepID=A0ABW7H560_9BURK